MKSRAIALPPAVHLQRVAVDVADLAAAFVRDNVGAAATSHTKTSPTDVVTFTDLQSEKLIRHELLARCPGSTIVGEEYDDATGANNVGWVVDPIDGTVNFLYDLPVVSVSIAATIDGIVVAGAVADVVRGEMFSAALDEGAQRDGMPVTTSSADTLAQSLIGTGFSYDAVVRAEQAEILTRLLPRCRDIRCMGSAALNLCWVGCGRLEAYYERGLKPYDFAAGALIASEGGAVSLPATPANHALTIAAAPGVVDEFSELLGTSAAGS